jgi:hypothetical protein
MNLPMNQGVVRVSITEVDPRPGLPTVKPTEPPGAPKEAMSPNSLPRSSTRRFEVGKTWTRSYRRLTIEEIFNRGQIGEIDFARAVERCGGSGNRIF